MHSNSLLYLGQNGDGPQAPPAAPLSGIPSHVETVIDIGHNVGVSLNSILFSMRILRVLIQGNPNRDGCLSAKRVAFDGY